MRDLELLRTQDGFVPANDLAWDKVRKIPVGSYCQGEIVRPRNPEFHRLFYALLRVGFEYWEPSLVADADGVYVPAVKNFEKYREDVLILAGHSEVCVGLDGTATVRACSISFAAMEEGEFRALYDCVKDILWHQIFQHIRGFTPEKLEEVTLQFMRF